REGATLLLSYLGEHQRGAIEDLSKGLNVGGILPCDVTKEEDLSALTAYLSDRGKPLHAGVHSLAFANREHLASPFVQTKRADFLRAQEVSACSPAAVARAVEPVMTEGGSISTLTYLGSTRVITNYNVMGVAKASLEASVRYLASDLGSRRIRVNGISAGPVK